MSNSYIIELVLRGENSSAGLLPWFLAHNKTFSSLKRLCWNRKKALRSQSSRHSHHHLDCGNCILFLQSLCINKPCCVILYKFVFPYI